MVRQVIRIFALCLVVISARAETTLTIATAANFKSTLQQIADRFTEQTNISVRISSASSGVLFSQIIRGAPFDLFFSADAKRPEELEAQGKVNPGQRWTYAMGQLVLVCHKPLRDWRNISGTLAVANPKTAPYGVAAMAVVEQLSYKPSRLVYGQNVAQTFQYFQSHNADCAMVGASLLSESNGAFRYDLPINSYPAIIQQAVVLNNSQQQSQAQKFRQFMNRPDIQQLMQNNGFLLP